MPHTRDIPNVVLRSQRLPTHAHSIMHLTIEMLQCAVECDALMTINHAAYVRSDDDADPYAADHFMFNVTFPTRRDLLRFYRFNDM